jgi:hypothetical protein
VIVPIVLIVYFEASVNVGLRAVFQARSLPGLFLQKPGMNWSIVITCVHGRRVFTRIPVPAQVHTNVGVSALSFVEASPQTHTHRKASQLNKSMLEAKP